MIKPPKSELKLQLSQSQNGPLVGWARSMVQRTDPVKCSLLGLINGSRYPCDRRVVDRLALNLSTELRMGHAKRRTLLVRLDIYAAGAIDTRSTTDAPSISESPLGPWEDLSVAIPVGATASPALLQLPKRLRQWRREYSLVIFDLGPLNNIPSRTIGRLCDYNFLILGPNACASSNWIQQHIAWHQQSGSKIDGSILTTVCDRYEESPAVSVVAGNLMDQATGRPAA
ncbi:MAG: hypothetical protein KDB22_12895 [Planctomycetales bacterium]|nr:hypothetical protein [Planctomycetales bacterium]